MFVLPQRFSFILSSILKALTVAKRKYWCHQHT